jgi:hypothetical protein
VAKGDPWWAWFAFRHDPPTRWRATPLFWRLYIVVASVVVFALTAWLRRRHHVTWTSTVLVALGPTAICFGMLVLLYRLRRP